MSDRLKQFIDENRDQFDTEVPPPALFGKIAAGIPGHPGQPRMIARRWKWAAAAAIVALLGLALTWWLTSQNKKEVPLVKNPQQEQQDDLALPIDPEYASQISQFRQMIGLQQNELKQLEKEYPQLYHQFVTDINELDSSYQSLKTKLPQNPNKEMLLEAMIQNLQLQSELLSRQLQIIKQIKQKAKNHEAKISYHSLSADRHLYS